MNSKLALVATAIAALTLTGCGGGQDDKGTSNPAPTSNPTSQSPPATPTAAPGDTPTPGTTPSSPPVAPPTTAPPKPTKPAPTAADGTNYKSCTDGRCEVSVRTGTRIPAKQSLLGFKTLTITRVSAGTVDFAAKSGCCSLSGGGQSPGSVFHMNNLKIVTIAVAGKTAILRLSPA
ncbi:hypothetical protein [Streptomyces sp. SID13031]|uniref:hypothetical protein n=1 Tax=Streptomyces sp. SID13031 TaxID=2706046 RepID=UPI0013C670D9|nr:hypothetical protein [Streptomyces sp. SID13031]NEA34647.1 hypothetical protein [Streptomyces sp. SID13031]